MYVCQRFRLTFHICINNDGYDEKDHFLELILLETVFATSRTAAKVPRLNTH